jgi:TctA family transporter
MEIFENLMHGFSVAFALENLMWAAFGVFMGNLIGVLPGMGVLATISILLPLTYTMTPTAALVMLSGIYYGSQYGGGITAILLNLPGTASHAVACLDGNPLARKGRAGSALLVDLAFKFGPAEYFSMMLLGLLAGATLAKGSAIKGVAMVVVGLILGVVGTDINTGVLRFNFGILELSDGLQIVALAMGLFGVADFLKNINRLNADIKVISAPISMQSMRPAAGDIRQSCGALLRGTGIGAMISVLPGTSPTIASFISYALEKSSTRTAPLWPGRHRRHRRPRSRH